MYHTSLLRSPATFLYVKKMNIILDLDGTLIFGVEHPALCKPRPFLREFLFYCFSNFQRVSIWTASSADRYNKIREVILNPILKDIKMEFDFEWTSEKCTVKWKQTGYGLTSTYLLHKKLKKLWTKKPYNKSNTIIIDDTASTFQLNYGNGILIPSYYGHDETQLETNYLMKLCTFLDSVQDFFKVNKSIRYLEKRNWWEKYE